jgi:membrane protease YdiL (CAAX protease family)
VGLLALLAVHVTLRAEGLFGPARERPLILLSFLLLWPAPWLLLRRKERQVIGFAGARELRWWPLAALAGMATAALCFGLCYALYRDGAQNPFVSIRQSFLGGRFPAVGPLLLFVIFTGPALIFSPVGEELFCRAALYGRVSQRLGRLAGVLASASVFATVHLLHHGLTWRHGELGFIGASGALFWVMMFATSLVFSTLRRAGGSIWLCVVSHSAFNLVMNAAIFSVLV